MVSYKWRRAIIIRATAVLILIVMDNGLLQHSDKWGVRKEGVLILIVMDNGLLHPCRRTNSSLRRVLILIVMDNGLLQITTLDPNKGLKCLNPYCNG